MPARILHGQIVAERLHRNIEQGLQGLDSVPTLAILDATGEPSAARSCEARSTAAGSLGVQCQVHRLPAQGAGRELLDLIRELAEDPCVHAIVLQAPLPREYASLYPWQRIPPEKDVEGLHPFNLGRLMVGSPLFVPATAAACIELLHHYELPLASKRAVVVGRSLVVGRPLALLLLAEDATVTVCHSRTRDLAYETRQAEVLVVAAGQPELVTASMVSPGAVVLDVGTNLRADGQIVGDVEQAGVHMVASALSPPVGGLEPVTTALLLWQTVEAARLAAARG
ncbi:MAG: bifunctional 5,10-methylenetetrahydrofolate dehydrogenase/5,10-methenyltetrahydrofolate cyclohydrolase [Candidatus Eremiobacterota bacterium]